MYMNGDMLGTTCKYFLYTLVRTCTASVDTKCKTDYSVTGETDRDQIFQDRVWRVCRHLYLRSFLQL